MAMIFQEPMTALNPSYTIGDQLADVHRPQALDGAPRANRAVDFWKGQHQRRASASGNSRTSSPALAPARDDRHGADVRTSLLIARADDGA